MQSSWFYNLYPDAGLPRLQDPVEDVEIIGTGKVNPSPSVYRPDDGSSMDLGEELSSLRENSVVNVPEPVFDSIHQREYYEPIEPASIEEPNPFSSGASEDFWTRILQAEL